MIKILIVDDHIMFRQGIAKLIQEHPEYDVIGETDTGNSAIKLAETLSPDIIILDLSLPDMDGIEVVRKIRAKKGREKIIILSIYKYSEIVEHLEDLKIDGYVLKNDAFEDLLYAIKAVYKGKKYVSPSLVKESFNLPKMPFFSSSVLTKREKEVLYLITEGFTNKEIAKRLGISIKTVETHRAKIMEKVKAKNLAELIKYAITTGEVTLSSKRYKKNQKK